MAALVLFVFSSPPAASQTIGRTDPNTGLFPDSSIVDFQYLLNAPAGKNGFLQVGADGRFRWKDGRRVRFWGVNISNRSVFIDHEKIDRVVDVLARAGCNMVRFEALDSIGGLTDREGSDSSRSLDPGKLKTLDYWVSKIRAKGIYYYIDLLDFRQFKAGDEVPSFDLIGRAAKPYAFFDRRLIDLQKEFADQFLTHKNAFTNLRYVDDPALALVEICNEHGLFFKATNLDNLAEPYGAVLRQLWNNWLQKQYGNRDALKVAWGDLGGISVLSDSEKLSDYSIALPVFAPPPASVNGIAPPSDPRRAPIRVSDGVKFLYELQRAYFKEMKSYLRQIGVKVPITGVVSNEMAADVASAAAEMDFTSENYYFDHPAFAGKDWEGAFFINDTNPLRYSSTFQLAPWLGALRWQNKPVVVREWATVWPNRYRAVAIPEMAAYASLQDFDAVLLFGYQITREPDAIRDFDHQADPPVWGMFGLGAQAFLRGDIQPAPYSATLRYSPDRLFRWPGWIGNLHRLAWFVRFNSDYAQTTARTKPPSRSSHQLASRSGKAATQFTRTFSRDLDITTEDSNALGSILDSFRLAGAPVSGQMLATGMLMASTGQLIRQTLDGLLTVVTSRTVSICGELPAGKPVALGPWTVVSPTPVGALMIVSLDGKPLDKSSRYLIKMVSRAENTGQALDPAPAGAPARFKLKDWGKAPILTFGRPSETPFKLRLGNRTVLTLGIADGSWEALIDGAQAVFSCDTRGIAGTLLGHPFTTGAQPQVIKLQ